MFERYLSQQLDNLTTCAILSELIASKAKKTMQTIQVGQLKSEFSSVLEQVQQDGETFIIEFGKKHKKVAMIVPYKEESKKRVFGQLKGKLNIPTDFDDESDEINNMFYGSD